MSELWDTREQALVYLSTDLPEMKTRFDRVFQAIDELIDAINDRIKEGVEANVEYATVCGSTLAKGKNLAHGMFSLALDGLAQEAGALARPLMECYEKLEFVRCDPSRASLLLKKNPPQPGKIAAEIDSTQKQIRKYFNQHASHIAYSLYSMRHLVDWRDHAGMFKKRQPFAAATFERNLWVLLGMAVRLGVEAVGALLELGIVAYEPAIALEGLRVELVQEADKWEDARAGQD